MVTHTVNMRKKMYGNPPWTNLYRHWDQYKIVSLVWFLVNWIILLEPFNLSEHTISSARFCTSVCYFPLAPPEAPVVCTTLSLCE